MNNFTLPRTRLLLLLILLTALTAGGVGLWLCQRPGPSAQPPPAPPAHYSPARGKRGSLQFRTDPHPSPTALGHPTAGGRGERVGRAHAAPQAPRGL